jgi:hypothetical protein
MHLDTEQILVCGPAVRLIVWQRRSSNDTPPVAGTRGGHQQTLVFAGFLCHTAELHHLGEFRRERAPATNFLTRLMTASDPELPINPLRGGHSDCAKRTVPRRTGQADLRADASPGTGSATLRQKAAKRGSPL